MARAEYLVGIINNLADAVLFIVSEKSQGITGQVISVRSGITGA
jgi:enoyl-[acyl-carrier-protein] reductase (NADH)